MTAQGSIYVAPGSRIGNFAQAVAWLWRLGPLLDSPDPAAVGLGWLDDAAELNALVDSGRLAGAAVFATRPGPNDGPMPSRARVTGVASFGRHSRVAGQFYILEGGKAAVRSSLGVHAVRDDRWMVLGADPDTSWGALDGFWVLRALADFIVDVLDRPLVTLPSVGWVRYDDVPGTAYHQVAGNDKPDDKMRRRIESAAKLFAAHDARLNLAIASRALVEGSEAAIDDVWPQSVAAIGRGIEDGVIEPVCHGYMHLDTDAWARGEINPREFRAVDREEADRRLDVSLSWFEGALGTRPPTFVAPTWAYSAGLIEALAGHQLPAWLPPEPGPLVDAGNGRETLSSGLEGLFRLDYEPFAALAGAGLPPSIVVHGGLFDSRPSTLRKLREAPTTARLVLRRDLFRFPWVSGVRWIGAGELLDRLRGHGEIEVRGDEIDNPAGFDVVVRDSAGRRLT
ncbi:MAG: hypothetical protein M3R23_07380, partial [Actinomycetota bacterium]|nr:hypothetical protein [Actinomycetota bacterium]